MYPIHKNNNNKVIINSNNNLKPQPPKPMFPPSMMDNPHNFKYFF
jgi:hypothetical protein